MTVRRIVTLVGTGWPQIKCGPYALRRVKNHSSIAPPPLIAVRTADTYSWPTRNTQHITIIPLPPTPNHVSTTFQPRFNHDHDHSSPHDTKPPP